MPARRDTVAQQLARRRATRQRVSTSPKSADEAGQSILEILQISSPSGPSSPFAAASSTGSGIEEQDIVFRREVTWCIQQLELGLKYRRSEATRDQLEESERIIRLLKSDKVRKARKAQIMHNCFGNVGALMSDPRYQPAFIAAQQQQIEDAKRKKREKRKKQRQRRKLRRSETQLATQSVEPTPIPASSETSIASSHIDP